MHGRDPNPVVDNPCNEDLNRSFGVVFNHMANINCDLRAFRPKTEPDACTHWMRSWQW